MKRKLKTAEIITDQPIGRYLLIKKIGSGGMGCVYKAYDIKLERTVALKLLSSSIRKNEDSLKRFEREAISNAKLRHPNIVTLYDFEQENDLYFLTMDFIDGPTLNEFLKQQPISFEKSCHFMLQILEGLRYAHSKGVIHRDIKPGNILIDREEKLFIADFGLAKIPSKATQISCEGSILGTPAYMSPEQASMNSESLDHRCDIYASGVLFYEMLTGQIPFQGEFWLVLTKLMSEKPRKPKEINPEIPDALERICLKAMEKKREDRYQSTTEFIQDIQDYLNRKDSLAIAPISRPASLEALPSHAEESSPSEKETRQKKEKRKEEKKNILLVDENTAVTEVLLKVQGYRVAMASNVMEALRLLETENFDLIVSEVDLPEIDGFQFLQHLRQIGISTPFIFLTARKSAEDEMKGLSMGISHYITKPFRVEIFSLRVQNLFKKKSTT